MMFEIITGFLLGAVTMAFGYHRLFKHHQDTIQDLKDELLGKEQMIRSLRKFASKHAPDKESFTFGKNGKSE